MCPVSLLVVLGSVESYVPNSKTLLFLGYWRILETPVVGLGLGVQGLGFKVKGSGIRVQGLGLRVGTWILTGVPCISASHGKRLVAARNPGSCF